MQISEKGCAKVSPRRHENRKYHFVFSCFRVFVILFVIFCQKKLKNDGPKLPIKAVAGNLGNRLFRANQQPGTRKRYEPRKDVCMPFSLN